MIIERLSFILSQPDRLQEFIDADTKVWEPWLRQQKGYIRKHYQRYPTGRVDIRIWWNTKEDLARASADPQIAVLEVKLKSEFPGVFHALD
jgi:hypothetical protein